MEMTRDLFKIIGDVKGRWHTKMVKIKNRNGKDWIEAEEIKTRWQNTHENESHSVMSNSLWPDGLFSPWNSPGQHTGVGSLSLLQGTFPAIELRSLTLQVDYLPAEPQGKPKSNGVGILSLIQQIFLTQELSGVSCTTCGFFTNWALREPPKYTCEIWRKVVNDLDNQDLGIHLESDNCTHLTC